jgi:hypothetical protein
MRKQAEHICQQCGKSFVSREKLAKFCSHSCSAKYGNKARFVTESQRKKAAESMLRYWKNHPGELHKVHLASQKGKHKSKMNISSVFDLPSRTRAKIISRLKSACFNCGWDQGTGDLHHIIPKSKGGDNKHENLTYLCPNCHRLAHEGKIPATTLKSLSVVVGERWKEFYYG